MGNSLELGMIYQRPWGWMDLTLFSVYVWFKEHFLPYAPSACPLLLLIDGHISHFCPEMIQVAAKEGVILFTLPPNTTHLCQPLEKGPFAPLKIEWRKAVHQFISSYEGQVVTLYEFNTVFAQAWYNSMTAGNIISGFRCTGIFLLIDMLSLEGLRGFRSLTQMHYLKRLISASYHYSALTINTVMITVNTMMIL